MPILFSLLSNKADLTESQLHALMEIVKAIIAAAVTFFVIRRHMRKERKRQEQLDRIEKSAKQNRDYDKQ